MKIWYGEQSLKSMFVTGQVGTNSSIVKNVKSLSMNLLDEGNCSSRIRSFQIPYTDYMNFVILMEPSKYVPHVQFLQNAVAMFQDVKLDLIGKRVF